MNIISINLIYLEKKRISVITIRSIIFSGDGEFTRKSEYLLEKKHNVRNCLLTNSCTSALEMKQF